MKQVQRMYWAILRGSIITGLVYRFGFLFTILGNVVYMCVAYFLWRSIYRQSTTIHGLTFEQSFIYVALGSTVFILLKTYAEWAISREINDGKIAVYLTKPLDYQLYWLFLSLGFTVTNLVAITLPTVLLITLVFKVPIIARSRPGPLSFQPGDGFSDQLQHRLHHWPDGLLHRIDLGLERDQRDHRLRARWRAPAIAVLPCRHSESAALAALSGHLLHTPHHDFPAGSELGNIFDDALDPIRLGGPFIYFHPPLLYSGYQSASIEWRLTMRSARPLYPSVFHHRSAVH